MTLDELILINNKEFYAKFGEFPEYCSFAPGRINIIGEHTDYCFGLALPAAINRWTVVSGSPREDNQIIVYSSEYEEEFVTDSSLMEYENKWQKFVLGCFSETCLEKGISSGFQICIHSNVPIGSGLSSSASFALSLVTFFNETFELGLSDMDKVKICQIVEHRYVYTKCGLLDQMASQFSKENKTLLVDFRDLTVQEIPFLTQEFSFLIVNTNVKRELATSAYGERVKETLKGLKQLKPFGINHFRDISEKDLANISDLLIMKRLKHIISENQRVLKAVDSLGNKDFRSLGNLMNESHESLKNDYEVSCEELDFLQNLLFSNKDCLGSRMMGGGFGGSTIGLIKKGSEKHIKQEIENQYKDKFGISATFFLCEIVNGASSIN